MKTYKNTSDNSILRVIKEQGKAQPPFAVEKVFVVVFDKDFKRQEQFDTWINLDYLTEENGFIPYPEFKKDYEKAVNNDLKEVRK